MTAPTPQEITALASLLEIIKMMSGWPFASLFLLIIIGPWVFAGLLKYSDRKRFEEVVKMYEGNVRLVEQTNKQLRDYEKIAADLKDVVMINTQTFSQLTDAIKHNQFCPIVRDKGGMG